MQVRINTPINTSINTYANGEFHDGFHDLPFVPGNQVALIVTMPPSYAITAVAYAQPYTNYYISDRITRQSRR